MKQVGKNVPLHGEILKSFSMHGQMAVVGYSIDEINEVFNKVELKHTCIACYNSPKGQTVSGPSNITDSFLKVIKQNK